MAKTVYLYLGQPGPLNNMLLTELRGNEPAFSKLKIYYSVNKNIMPRFESNNYIPYYLFINEANLMPDEKEIYKVNHPRCKNTLVNEVNYIKAANNEKLILSCDMLYSHANVSELVKFKSFFNADTVVKPVIYLHRQDEYLMYWYKYLAAETKKWFIKDYKAYLTPERDKHTKDSKLSDSLNYASLIALLGQVFGKENVIVRIAEPEQLVNNNIFDDFLKVCGIDKTPDFKTQTTVTREMPNYLAIAKSIIGSASSDKEVTDTLDKFFAEYNMDLHTTKTDKVVAREDKPLFSGKERLQIIKTFEESNGKVAAYLKKEQLFVSGLPNADDKSVDSVLTKDVMGELYSKLIRYTLDKSKRKI